MKLAAACLGLLAAGAGHAAIDLAGIGERLAGQGCARSDFVQEKVVKGFAAPFVSEGRAIAGGRLGLCWRQEKPFPAEFTITPAFLSQKLPGQERQVITRESGGGLFRFASLVAALASGDCAVLEREFSVEVSGLAGGRWRLVLVPRDGALARAVTRIVAEGGDGLDFLEIRDGQGDVTAVTFSARQPVSCGSQELRRHFEP